MTVDHQAELPARAALAVGLALALVIGGLLAMTLHRTVPNRPLACGQLDGSLRQLANDLGSIKPDATGNVNARPLTNDGNALSALAAGSTAAFAARVLPITTALNALLTAGSPSLQGQDVQALGQASATALHWCGLSS